MASGQAMRDAPQQLPETLHQKLAQAAEFLCQAENALHAVHEKLYGPDNMAEKAMSSTQPNSVSAYTLEIINRAIRLRDALDNLNAQIA